MCSVNLVAARTGEGALAANRIIQILSERRQHKPLADSAFLVRGGKCGLWLSFEVIKNWDAFSPSEREQIRSLLEAPPTQKDRVIGYFRFYYDTTGSDVPTMLDSNYQPVANSYEQFVDSAGVFFNHAWSIEINTLGYSSPPLDTDGTYHVVIDIAPDADYGETYPDLYNPINGTAPVRYKSYIEIDNSFANVYAPSRGMPGLKVTAAHEFHHAIQLGSYGVWWDQLYLYEITSTWMEDVVYNEVNDYYQYLFSSYSQFSHPDIRFTKSDGLIMYSRAVWGKYVEKRFSRDLIRHVWENVRREQTLPALDDALIDAGSSFREAFLEWGFWNFYTGVRADTTHFYSEGNNYPAISLRSTIEYIPPGLSFIDSIEVLSSVYHPILVNNDTMLAIVSNINLVSTMSTTLQNFSYDMSSQSRPDFKHLSNGISVKLNAADPENWSSWESARAQTPDVIVFPDPFVAQSGKTLKFRLPYAAQSTALVHIFGSSMNRVYENELPVSFLRPFETYVVWNAHGNKGEPLATGIYFYVIEIDNNQYHGKFAVIKP